ncbi:1-acyl-sn-glycerol-3-phosphate acyltransferase [Hydrogenophaga sp. R2]|uniref:1-acyl-sn-glycerol-3-phosphate acyltransferase n=1 Tax=Hydrogenophaga sp. R2 TaxID=3132827 RepID=UPI003CF16279
MHSDPGAALPVRFPESRVARALLRLAGWRVTYNGFPTRQGVAIVYPHTSNWDFVVMVLAKWTIGIPARWWGKDSLFRVPVLGRWMRWLGGIPLDRRSARGVVGEMVAVFEDAKASDELLWLGLSPEGTRSHTPGWRSGFYQVALGARVPVALIRLDYGQREVRITDFIHLSGDVDADYARMAEAYHGVRGQRPDQASPIAPLPKRPTPDTV